MLQIENGTISGFSITGNAGASLYAGLLPITHDSGVAFWVIDPSGQDFTDSDGQTYHLKKRTLAEIQAMPQYQAWLTAQQIDAAQNQAKVDFSTIPAWMKTFTAAQAEAYIETNVTNLATAKAAIKQMARMLILLRDYVRYSGQ